MSTFQVLVTTIEEINQHPNADKLEIAKVLGWQCVVAKGTWKVGDKCVYFPPDSMIPEFWATKLGVKDYLSKGTRVKCVRLRGAPSLGIVAPPDDDSWEEGQNVAEYYGTTKYEPPKWARKGTAGDAKAESLHFPKYVKIENLRTINGKTRWHLFRDEQDHTKWAEVVATEKIHGMNFRFGFAEDEWQAGSRTVNRKQPENWPNISVEECPIFWMPGLTPGLRNLVEELKQFFKSVVVYGEIYGKGVQPHMDYGLSTPGFILFDILVDNQYMNYDEFVQLCDKYSLPRVPELYRGPYSHEDVVGVAAGQTQLGATHIREGIVVKPVVERLDSRGNRVVMKFVSDEYHLKQYDEFSDE